MSAPPDQTRPLFRKVISLSVKALDKWVHVVNMAYMEGCKRASQSEHRMNTFPLGGSLEVPVPRGVDMALDETKSVV